MLVRSASTPILGALHPSGCHSPAVSSPAVHFPESPASAYHPSAISCHLPAGGGGGSDHERLRGNGAGGIRRTSSEGNLAFLAGRAEDHHHHHLLPPSGKCAPPRARPTPPLQTIESFTNRDDAATDDDDEDDDETEDRREELSFGHFSFVGSSAADYQEHPLFLARGLGIDRLGSGLLSAGGGGDIGGGGSHLVTSGGGNSGDSSGIETHYKKMIEEDPCNGLFLRNYAQFLCQCTCTFVFRSKGITGGQRSTTPEQYWPTQTTASSCRSTPSWSGTCTATKSAPPATSSGLPGPPHRTAMSLPRTRRSCGTPTTATGLKTAAAMRWAPQGSLLHIRLWLRQQYEQLFSCLRRLKENMLYNLCSFQKLSNIPIILVHRLV